MKIKKENRAFILYLIQLVLTSLLSIPVYSLVPLLETAISAHRIIDTPLVKAVFQIVSGGVIVFFAGILIDKN